MQTLFTATQRSVLREATYAVDKEARAHALKVWGQLTTYVARNIDNLPPIQLTARPGKPKGFYVKGPHGGLPRGLFVMLMPSHHKEIAGSFARSAQLGDTIAIYGVVKQSGSTEGLVANMKGPKYRSTFVHEFVHYLDQLRRKGKGEMGGQSARATARGDYEGYFRTPAEFNSHFQQIADRVEQDVMHTVANKSRDDLEMVFDSYRTFERYVRGLFRFGPTLTDLEHAVKGTKWERKWLKRMHGLYKGLKADAYAEKDRLDREEWDDWGDDDWDDEE